MKKFFRYLATSMAVFSMLLFLFAAFISAFTPSEYSVTQTSGVDIETKFPIRTKSVINEVSVEKVKSHNQTYKTDIMLMKTIPIKKVKINMVEEKKVVPCGIPFGVKIFTDGVLVIGTTDVCTDNELKNPAKIAGIKKGDVIISINNEKVNTNEDVSRIIEESKGNDVDMCLRRNNVKISTKLEPVKSKNDGVYKAGLWIRDSSAGIGTMTFYDKDTEMFAGLGHGICDVDTGNLLPLLKGDIVRANIDGVVKGARGVPGELKGYFTDYTSIGSLSSNIESGVYGNLTCCPSQNEEVVLAMKQQVRRGNAKILTTICGEQPQYYEIRIDSVNYNERVPTKNMIITITDPELLKKTGGIVQGMSGSPIIQNGMLVGAVTHVFINEPTRGYGIFAENMIKNCTRVSEVKHKKAS